MCGCVTDIALFEPCGIFEGDGPVRDTSHSSQFEALGASLGAMVEKKQAAYGDSFGKSGRVLAELFPGGITLSQLDDALTLVRIVDKLFRIATDKDAFGEDPYQDIAGYCLLAIARRKAGK